MPELPEVTNVARKVNDLVAGKKITGAMIFLSTLLKNSNVENFKQKIKHQTINSVTNVAKYLIFKLDNYVLISHLRMTGKWVFEHITFFSYNQNWCKAQLLLEDDYVLRFYDSRAFGTLEIYTIEEYLTSSKLQKLGPIPLNNGVTSDYLFAKTMRSKKAIKTLLLDQHIIAGLGNIYVNEVLFLSKINPERRANSLTFQEVELIIKNSEEVLEDAISLGGSTIDDFESAPGESGSYQHKLRVHCREKQDCIVCKQKIFKIKVNGRGTYYCSQCQK